MNPKLRNFLSPPSFKGWLKSLLRSFILGYVILIIAALNVNHLLFHPPGHHVDFPGQVKLHTAAGDDITALYQPNPQAAYVVLFSYGNGEDMASNHDYMVALHNRGWGTCGYDYPGYGTSSGKPSEAGCIAAIDAVYDYLTKEQHIPAERIILYGHSLGSGPTIDLASRKPVGGLILEGAYLSIFRVVTHFRVLPWDVFNNIAKISSIHVPLLSIHALNDHTVPFWHGEKLYDTYTGPKQNYWVPNADHNTILEVAWQPYWEAVEKYRESLPLKNP